MTCQQLLADPYSTQYFACSLLPCLRFLLSGTGLLPCVLRQSVTTFLHWGSTACLAPAHAVTVTATTSSCSVSSPAHTALNVHAALSMRICHT